MNMLLGHPMYDILKLIRYTELKGFHSITDFLESVENPIEYTAKVSLLQARLKRIEELTKINI